MEILNTCTWLYMYNLGGIHRYVHNPSGKKLLLIEKMTLHQHNSLYYMEQVFARNLINEHDKNVCRNISMWYSAINKAPKSCRL